MQNTIGKWQMRWQMGRNNQTTYVWYLTIIDSKIKKIEDSSKIVALSDVILLKSALNTPIEDKVLSIYIIN